MKKISDQVLSLDQTQQKQKQPLEQATMVIQTLGQDMVDHQENLQDIFTQLERLDNQQCKNNIRLKNLQKQAEGPHL